jgi:ABC-type glycerol-3-phosphate transport system substrate-binding protein
MTETRVTRRQWLIRFVSTMAAGAAWGPLAACGSAASQAAAPVPTATPRRPSPYTVHLRLWGSDRLRRTFEQIAADFNLAHDDVSLAVHPFATPGATPSPSGSPLEAPDPGSEGEALEAYDQQFLADLAAGTAADLTYFAGWRWQSFAAAGALQPLDDLATRDRWSAPWPGGEAYELQSRFRGRRFLVATEADPFVLYYVKQPFDEAALAYPKLGWTYAEFQDLCSRLTWRAGNRWRYGYQWNGGYARNMPWWRMFGQLEWDRLAEPRHASWNTGAVIEALQFQLYDSQYRLGISPTGDMIRQSSGSVRIEQGGVAMQMEAASFLPRMAGEGAVAPAEARFDVQLLPRGRVAKTPHLALLSGPAMTKMSRDKEAAWDALKWMTREEGQWRIADNGGLGSVPELARKLWLPLARNRYGIANAEAFLKALEHSTMTLSSPLASGVLDRQAGLAAALDAIRDGRLTARQALDELQPRLELVLESYWATQETS